MGQTAVTGAEAERLPPWLEAIVVREFHKNAVRGGDNHRVQQQQLPPKDGTKDGGDDGDDGEDGGDGGDAALLPPSPPPSPGGVAPPPPPRPGATGGTATATAVAATPPQPSAARLTLNQFIAMDFSSIKDVKIPLLDVTTLVLADRDGDGMFSLERDVLGFALHVYRTYGRLAKIAGGTPSTGSSLVRSESTIKSLVTGELVRELWARLVDADGDGGGVQRVATHICTIVLANKTPVAFSSQPGVAFVDSDTVHTMFRMLAVARSHRMGFQPFFDLMQQSAEDCGLMDLEEEEFDNFVPLEVMQEFVTTWLIGFCNLVPLHRDQARGL
jgi:hypothetical protein